MSEMHEATPNSVPTAGRLDGRVRALCVLFFFSGFPALLYQLVWQRALFRVLGVNIESVTIVVTAFMLGLGIGSIVGGWLSRRHRAPVLLWLAAIELLTGAFGLISLRVFELVGERVVGLPLPLVALVTLSLVIVPTLLMGATLPLLVGHLVGRDGEVGKSVGLMYYVNTLGASVACLAGMTALFPLLGMQGSILFAVAVNALVAIGAVAAHFFDRRPRRASPPAPRSSGASGYGLGSVLLFSGASGFVALSLEIAFFRLISYTSGSSASAFAATLGIFLLGLAVGGREGGEAAKSVDRDALVSRMVRVITVAMLASALLLPAVTHLAWLGDPVLGIAVFLVFVVARNWGFLLPALAELGIASNERAGMRTAQLYLANIVGSASGSIVTGFVLTERLSLTNIVRLVCTLGLLLAVVLMIRSVAARRSSGGRVVAFFVASVLVLALLPSLTRGMYENLHWKGADERVSFTDVVETRSGIIAVDADGTVYGDNVYDGRFNVDPVTDGNGIIRPYALGLFHPDPKRVLMIGLATGSWAQVIVNHPDVESLTIVEINDGYRSLVRERAEVASLLENPKTRYVYDDGRRWLGSHPEQRFDAIVANTTFHFRANATNLLSSEFLQLASRHLAPEGILLYNSTGSARVQRTACLAFEHGARFTNHMVVSNEPVRWDFARWRETLEGYRIDGDAMFASPAARRRLDEWTRMESHIEEHDPDPDVDLIETCPEVLERTEGLRPITDDNMGTEWRSLWNLD